MQQCRYNINRTWKLSNAEMHIRYECINRPLSLSWRPSETRTGTYHPSGLSSCTSSPSMARWMISSLPTGGGGTLESQAMLMKILCPIETGIAALDVGGEYMAGCKAEDLIQKPGTGLRSMGTVDMTYSSPGRTLVCSGVTLISNVVHGESRSGFDGNPLSNSLILDTSILKCSSILDASIFDTRYLDSQVLSAQRSALAAHSFIDIAR